MGFKKVVLGTLVVLGVAGVGGWFSLDKETRGLLATVPTNRDLLFWTQPQRDAAFRALDSLPILAKSNVVPASGTPSALHTGAPLKLPSDVDAYMAGQRSAALLVVHDGKLRLERYGLGFDGAGRWTSFSVAKSFTSTLVGAAVKDGFIKSLDDNAATLQRTVQHLVDNGVDLEKYPLSLGPLLKFDPEKEVFPASPAATALVTREYREGFVCPTADKV